MQSLIYAGLRNGHRDQLIYDALQNMRVIEVATLYQLHPSTIRAAAKRIENVAVYELCLIGGVYMRASLRVAHNCSFDDRIMRIAIMRIIGTEAADAFKAEPNYCTALTSKPIASCHLPSA